jgi:hypothetical protein
LSEISTNPKVNLLNRCGIIIQDRITDISKKIDEEKTEYNTTNTSMGIKGSRLEEFINELIASHLNASNTIISELFEKWLTSQIDVSITILNSISYTKLKQYITIITEYQHTLTEIRDTFFKSICHEPNKHKMAIFNILLICDQSLATHRKNLFDVIEKIYKKLQKENSEFFSKETSELASSDV